MKPIYKISLLLTLTFWSCYTKTESINSLAKDRKIVEMITDHGIVVIELYNETPLHRDNFIKLIKQNAYDSLLFHRVIEKFMIQGGDPDSRNAKPQDTLGNGELSYTIKAEFNPVLFHKKGSLAAARTDNPERASSSIQFYIVQGKIYNDSLLNIAEKRINGWLAEYYIKKDSIYKPLVDSLQKTLAIKDLKQYTFYNDSLKELAKTYNNFERYTIPESHRKIYKSIGGTPHLDQNYTVFGEVIKGFNVIDSIASIQTGIKDRPISDVRIRSVKVIEKD